MARRIILIKGSGFKSGKDTTATFIADILNKKRKSSVYKGMFAYTVKELCEKLTGLKMFNVLEDEFDNYPYKNKAKDFSQAQKETYLKEWGMTLGRMLQLLAMEGMRNGFDKKIHVKGEARRLNDMLHKYGESGEDVTIIISDWRFPNEEGINHFMEGDWKTYTLEVSRTNLDHKEGEVGGRDMSHASETFEMEFGWEISNNGTLQDLMEGCDAFVESILEFE